MANLKITGGNKLSGEIKVAGNKNAALPCLAAALLLPPDQPAVTMTISNIPHILDVQILTNILKSNGLKLDESTPEKLTISNQTFRPNQNRTFSIPPLEARRFRGAILLLGPLLRYFQKVVVPQVGGCKIGPRPIDSHLQGFAALGIDTTYPDTESYCLEHNPTKEKMGYNKIWLKEASVTATENLLLYLAVNPQIKQTVTIINAACEPHVQSLCDLLGRMGAIISGRGTNVLDITPGATYLKNLQFRLEPDYIEALTYAVAGAITHSNITINNIVPHDLTLISWYLNEMGVYNHFTSAKNGNFCWKIYGQTSPLKINPSLKDIKAEPWPGLPTDALPLFVILTTQCQGEIEFVDYMYDGRLTNLIGALQRMGADIISLGNRNLSVRGPHPLQGQTELSPDLRNGVALVLAGLCAEGETVIQNFEIIERGYDHLPEKLLTLGAKVEKS